MSLINDALKRAKQAQQQNPSGGPPAVPLQPVDYPSRPNYLLRPLIALLAVVTLACSGWFFWKWWNSRVELRSGAAVTRAKVDPAPRANLRAQFAPRNSVIQVSTNIVVRSNVAAAPLPEAEPRSTPTNGPLAAASTNADLPAPVPEFTPPPAPFADLKLRSII